MGMIAKASIHPDATGPDPFVVALVVAMLLVALFVLDWVRN